MSEVRSHSAVGQQLDAEERAGGFVFLPPSAHVVAETRDLITNKGRVVKWGVGAYLIEETLAGLDLTKLFGAGGGLTTYTVAGGVTLGVTAAALSAVGIGDPPVASPFAQDAALDAATGDEVAFALSYTVNKLTSGNDTALAIVRTDTASPGTSRAIDVRDDANRFFAVLSNGTIDCGQAVSGAGQDFDFTTQKGQTPGTHKAGNWIANVGAPASGITAQWGARKEDGTKLWTVREIGGPTVHMAFGSAADASYRGGLINATSLNIEISAGFYCSSPTSATFDVPFLECGGQISSDAVEQAYAANLTLNFNTGNHHRVSTVLTGNITFAFSNARDGAIYTVQVTQDGDGGATVTWPAATRFEGTDATAGAGANEVTVWTFLHDGTVSRCVSKKVFAS